MMSNLTNFIEFPNTTDSPALINISDHEADIIKLEQLIHEVALLGKKMGYENITDKMKWREVIMARILKQNAFTRMSAGRNSDRYGSDAFDPVANKNAEYKSVAVRTSKLNNLLQKIKSKKKNSRYKSLSISGVYNGAYTYESLEAYSKHDHYFGVFYDEKCVLIIKVKTDYVIDSLRKGVDKMMATARKGKTSNGNSVGVNLSNTHLYEIAYRNDEWFENNA